MCHFILHDDHELILFPEILYNLTYIFDVRDLIMIEQKLSADDLQYISDWYMYYGLIAAHKYNEIDIWAWNHTVWPGLNGSYLGQNDPEACRRIYRRILLLAQNERVTPQTRKFTQ